MFVVIFASVFYFSSLFLHIFAIFSFFFRSGGAKAPPSPTLCAVPDFRKSSVTIHFESTCRLLLPFRMSLSVIYSKSLKTGPVSPADVRLERQAVMTRQETSGQSTRKVGLQVVTSRHDLSPLAEFFSHPF